MPTDGIRRRAFAKAAEALGGTEPLARHLRVSKALAIEWMNATLPIPDFVFLKIIDLILDDISARDLADMIDVHDDPAVAAGGRARIALLNAGRDGREKEQG